MGRIQKRKEQSMSVDWLLKFYVLATSKVLSESVLAGDSAHSWWPFSAAPLGDH